MAEETEHTKAEFKDAQLRGASLVSAQLNGAVPFKDVAWRTSGRKVFDAGAPLRK